jgi:DnaJ-class molecular chaperone
MRIIIQSVILATFLPAMLLWCLWYFRPRTRNTTEPCPDCRAECRQCHGAREVSCLHHLCGGRGYIPLETHFCDCVKDGRPAADCAKCEGAGLIVIQKLDCPCCKGTKKQPCPACDGQGQESTGRLHGARPAMLGEVEPPDCPSCKGSGRKQERVTRKVALWAGSLHKRMV